MSEETIIVEVEPDSVKPHLFDANISEHSEIVVEETPFSVKDEEDGLNNLKGSVFVPEKTFGSNELGGHGARWNKINVSSRYLGSSSSSCHDFCKYGHRKTSKTASVGKNQTKISCSAEKRKKSVVRRLSFPVTKAENQIQMHGKEVKQCGKGTLEPKERLTTVEGHTKRSTGDKTLKEQNISQQKLLKSSSNMVRGVKDVQVEDKGLVSKTAPSKPRVRKAMSMDGGTSRDLSRLSHLKNHQSNCQQEVKAQSPEDVPEKILYMNEPIDKSAPAETSQWVPSESKRIIRTQAQSQTGSYFSDSKTRSSIPKTKSCTTRSKPEALKAKQSNSKQNGSVKCHLTEPIVPAMDNPCKYAEEVEEKSANGRRGDTISLDVKVKSNSPKVKPSNQKSKPLIAKQNAEANRKVAKAGKGQHEEEGLSSIWKMKFRRGKVIVLPTATNSPKKLKFRRPRGLIDSQHAWINPSKLKYKSKETEGEELQKDVDGLAKVVLRRQEATLKKGDLDLNNVIEETASKLVKTRKSKVKALVGAFETVMSLQDRKVNEETVAS